jgi:hypothetical protein
MIKAGTLVTWGSGKPKAIVLGRSSECADGKVMVRLTETQVAQCGAMFEAGLEFPIPEDWLREVPN